MWIQLIVTLFVVFAISRAYLQYRDNNSTLGQCFFWSVVWATVLVVVYWPNLIDRLAISLGISRSIDVVVYFSIIVLFYLIFRSYIKIQELEQQITELCQKLALKDICKK